MNNKDSMTMILTEDLEKTVRKYDDKIYDCVKLISPYDLLKTNYDECIENLYGFYDLVDKYDSFSNSKKKYLSNM